MHIIRPNLQPDLLVFLEVASISWSLHFRYQRCRDLREGACNDVKLMPMKTIRHKIVHNVDNLTWGEGQEARTELKEGERNIDR